MVSTRQPPPRHKKHGFLTTIASIPRACSLVPKFPGACSGYYPPSCFTWNLICLGSPGLDGFPFKGTGFFKRFVLTAQGTGSLKKSAAMVLGGSRLAVVDSCRGTLPFKKETVAKGTTKGPRPALGQLLDGDGGDLLHYLRKIRKNPARRHDSWYGLATNIGDNIHRNKQQGTKHLPRRVKIA